VRLGMDAPVPPRLARRCRRAADHAGSDRQRAGRRNRRSWGRGHRRPPLGVRNAGAIALRGGALKPRTSPYAFQGLGEAGLTLLSEVRRETGMPVVTEVLDTRQVELVAEHADVLQVGARNMQNYALLAEVGRIGRPVLLKRGFAATITELLF